MNMSKWFNLYSFDVMGDLAFGASYGCLESGEMHWAIKLLNDGMDLLGVQFPNWTFRLLLAIPGAAKDHFRFLNYCTEQLDRRIEMQGKSSADHQDISHTLIEHFKSGDEEAQRVQMPMLQGDSRLIIVAGSDTTAATLVHLFYHLATQPKLTERLREEVDKLVGKDGKLENAKISDANILNGSINEAMRLNPPVPSGVFRQTPAEGVDIGGTYIPGETSIQMPQYAMGRGTFVPLPPFIPFPPLEALPSPPFSNAHLRPRDLPLPPLLYPRTPHHPRRGTHAPQIQRRLPPLQHGSHGLHRQEPGVHGDSAVDDGDSAEV